MYGQDRDQIRRVYLDAWQKHRSGQALEPMEQIIVNVIQLHPEYHKELESPDTLSREYTPEMGQTNPFLHMGLHIAIHEQLSIDKPKGVRSVYKQLQLKHQDTHKVEHLIMDCLAEIMWESQSSGKAPDEKRYVKKLRKLTKS